MDTFKKILKPKKDKRASDGQIIDIGMPTQVDHTVHVENTEQGLRGLPKEFQDLLRHMLTDAEQSDGKTLQIAEDVLKWNEAQKQKTGLHYIKTIKRDISPGSSGELSSENLCTFYVPTPTPPNDNDNHAAGPNDHPDVDNRKVPELSKPTPSNDEHLDVENNSNTTSSPVLRRKNSKKSGPSVPRNMTEDEVMNNIQDLCANGHPLDRYDYDANVELGAGAAGTVFLASNKETQERVAIKKIDMAKQQKKEMILMEIKVIRHSCYT